MRDDVNYYYSDEVACVLGIPKSEMWRMKHLARSFENKQGYPKKVIDSIAESWFNILCAERTEKYYMLKDLATAIKRKPENLKKHCIEIHELFWISEPNAKQIIEETAFRQPWRRKAIIERLPNPKTRSEAERFSAACRIRELTEKLADERIIQEQLAAKDRELTEDRAEFERWLDDAQVRLDKEKITSEELRAKLKNSEKTIKLLKRQIASSFNENAASILSELEEARSSRQKFKVQVRDLQGQVKSLRSEIISLEGQLEDREYDAHILDQIRNLFDKN